MEADARSAIASENNDEGMDAVSAVVAEEDGGLVRAEKLDFTHFLYTADAGEEQPAEDRNTAAAMCSNCLCWTSRGTVNLHSFELRAKRAAVSSMRLMCAQLRMSPKLCCCSQTCGCCALHV